jgi:cytochrome c oxidase subunit 1
MFGRMYSERWGRIAALLVFVGFNLTFFTQFVMGSKGMPRRYYNYVEEFTLYHQASTVGSYLLGFGFVVMAVYLVHSLFRGERAADNPWGGATFEWETSSPPPTENFEFEFLAGDPYDIDSIHYDPEIGGFRRDDPESIRLRPAEAH